MNRRCPACWGWSADQSRWSCISRGESGVLGDPDEVTVFDRANEIFLFFAKRENSVCWHSGVAVCCELSGKHHSEARGQTISQFQRGSKAVQSSYSQWVLLWRCLWSGSCCKCPLWSLYSEIESSPCSHIVQRGLILKWPEREQNIFA